MWRLPKWCLSRSSALKPHVCPKQKAIYNRTNSRPFKLFTGASFPDRLEIFSPFFFECSWTCLVHIKDISVHIFTHRSQRLSEKNVFLIGALLTRGNYRRLGAVQRDGNGRWLGTRRHYCGGFGGGQGVFSFLITSFKFPSRVAPWHCTWLFAARLWHEVFICSSVFAQFSLSEWSTAGMRIPFVPQEAGWEEAAAERCHIAAALWICHFLWSWRGLCRKSGTLVVDLIVFLSFPSVPAENRDDFGNGTLDREFLQHSFYTALLRKTVPRLMRKNNLWFYQEDRDKQRRRNLN